MTNQIIIYPGEHGLVLVTPCECGLSVQEIARKDVPAGKPYLIVDKSEIPTDPIYAETWTADFSTPDGYGIGPEAWFAEQAAKENQ